MEKKNMVLLTVIAVATLLVAVVGATFAYFTASITNNYNGQGSNGKANVESGAVGSNNTVIANVDGQAGSFETTNVYPGHKEVAALKVTVTGSSAQKIDITYTPSENTFPDDNIVVKVYKSGGSVDIGEGGNYFNCQKQTGTEGDTQTFFETCDDTESGLGTSLGTHNLTQSDVGQTIVIGQDTITGVEDPGTTQVYYVVVEFVNKDSEAQDTAQSKSLKGQISVRLTP